MESQQRRLSVALIKGSVRPVDRQTSTILLYYSHSIASAACVVCVAVPSRSGSPIAAPCGRETHARGRVLTRVHSHLCRVGNRAPCIAFSCALTRGRGWHGCYGSQEHSTSRARAMLCHGITVRGAVQLQRRNERAGRLG
jgi:hypothetical protein